MKKVFILFCISGAFLTSCVNNPDGKKAETKDSVATASQATGAQLTVDTALSNIEWLGKKVTGQHHGNVKIKSGSVSVENGQPTGGSFVIDMTTIRDVDLQGEYKAKLEGHLKSADFFDAEKYPEATFTITEVKPDSATAKVTISGNLTIRGVSKNITFDATVSEATNTSFKAMADFNIAREDWGVNYAGKADDLISKEINLKITLVAKS